MFKDESVSSEKSQFLGDESSRLIGGLSKKGSDISDLDISEIWGKDLTLALKV